MNTCPYCGGLGRHIWAGTGQCPGIQENETERLQAVIQTQKIALGDQSKEINRLKALCKRAADVLDIMTQFLLVSDVPLEWEEDRRRKNKNLITELRNSEK